MTTTNVFMKSGMRIVRLPVQLGAPDGVEEVNACPLGRQQVISPSLKAWNSFFESRPVISTSFLEERSSQYQAAREDI